MLKRLKRIMRKFQINEISACDKPAQEHAQVLIMKRDSRGQGIMDEIIDDTPSIDQALLDSVQSILDDDELNTTARNVMLLDTVRQYVIYTGADTATARPGAPLGGLSSPDITVVEIHKRAEQDRRPGETVYQARARLFEDPANKDLVKRYNEAMAEAMAALADQEVLEKAKRRRTETPEQRKNRLKQEHAQRHGAPSKTSPVRKAVEGETFNSEATQALRKRADDLMKVDPTLTRSRALDRIASSRDETDREVWLAARRDAAD
jgi:hypothetical protein